MGSGTNRRGPRDRRISHLWFTGQVNFPDTRHAQGTGHTSSNLVWRTIEVFTRVGGTENSFLPERRYVGN